MLEALKKFLKSPVAKEILRLLLAALAGYGASGCSSILGAADHPSVAVLACKAEVLAPYVGDAAGEVARAIDGDRAFSAIDFLQAQGLSPAEIADVAERYMACEPARPEPQRAAELG